MNLRDCVLPLKWEASGDRPQGRLSFPRWALCKSLRWFGSQRGYSLILLLRKNKMLCYKVSTKIGERTLSKFLNISQSHNKIISVCIPQGIFLKLLHKDVKWWLLTKGPVRSYRKSIAGKLGNLLSVVHQLVGCAISYLRPWDFTCKIKWI